MIERTPNSNERGEQRREREGGGDGVTQTFRCVQTVACEKGERARPCNAEHKAVYTCTDGRSPQSYQLRANPSIAGWLGSNHHSQQGQNERMADSRWGDWLALQIDGTNLEVVHEASYIVTYIPSRISAAMLHWTTGLPLCSMYNSGICSSVFKKKKNQFWLSHFCVLIHSCFYVACWMNATATAGKPCKDSKLKTGVNKLFDRHRFNGIVSSLIILPCYRGCEAGQVWWVRKNLWEKSSLHN